MPTPGQLAVHGVTEIPGRCIMLFVLNADLEDLEVAASFDPALVMRCCDNARMPSTCPQMSLLVFVFVVESRFEHRLLACQAT